MPTVALTGSTGFIGGNLLDALRTDGDPVRALTRRDVPDETGSVEWIEGDLGDREALRRLVRGASHVVHCAGRVRGARAAPFEEVNVAGTRRLVEAAAEAGVIRFLLMSSLAAREPDLSWYAASKLGAESALREGAGEGMGWTVFRPTAVYGPGDREMAPVFESMRRGILPVVGRKDARFSLLHVDDLVAAVQAWLASEREVPGVFELHDGTANGYDWPLVAEIARQVWGRKVQRVRIPAGGMALVAGVNLVLARHFERDPMLTPGKVRELRHPNWVCDNTALREALDWSPRVSLRDAFEEDRLSP